MASHTFRPDLSPFFLTLDDLEGPIDWREFFGNENPVELDIGSGRGLFLVTAGLEHPDVNYLGIELEYREGRRAARRLAKRNLPNVRVLGGEARTVLLKYAPPGSVSALHVYFPDPWWKRKHRKRRLFTDEFADLAAQVLQPGGELHHRTDVKDYFEVVCALMDHHPGFEPLSPPPESSPKHDMDYLTSFERKKRKVGLPIYRGRWRRRGEEAGSRQRAEGSEVDEG